MNNDELESLPDDQRIDRRVGLQKFLTAEPTRPQPMCLEDYLALSEAERAVFDDERIDYLGTDIIVPTPQTKALRDSVRTLRLLNRRRNWGRLGQMISGGSGKGKTSVALTIARDVFHGYITKNPDWERNGDIPIVFVNIPGTPNGNSMVKQFANFYGIPYGKNDTLDYLKREVIPLLNNHKTQLVIVDELHNLSKRTTGDINTIRLLKEFSNNASATFLYAGVNIHRGGLLSGEEGEQIAGRFRARVLTNYGYSNTTKRALWKGLVRALAKEIPLFGETPETVAAHAKYLYKRTRGGIGPLNQLLIAAAQMAILEAEGTGVERITLDLLDSIELDLATERETGWYRHGDNSDVMLDPVDAELPREDRDAA